MNERYKKNMDIRVWERHESIQGGESKWGTQALIRNKCMKCVCASVAHLLALASRFKELPQGLSVSIMHNACSADNIF